MRNIFIVLFVSISLFINTNYAQKPSDSLSKRNALAKEIQKKSPEQIRDAYKKSHSHKPSPNNIKLKKIIKKKKLKQPSSVIDQK